MAFIYKITNLINNKVYIGYTDKSVEDRWKRHIKICRMGSKTYLHNAMRKYGVDKFSIEVISSNEDSKYTKNVLEPKYIKEYNSKYPLGYNLTDGGEGSLGHTVALKTRILISKIQRKYWKDPRYRERLSISRKKNWQDPIYIKNQRESQSKFLYKVTFPNGKVEIVRSLKFFCGINDLDDGHMYKVVKGTNKHHKGFKVQRLNKEKR
jgi:group I intron endonuclease